MMDLRTAHWLFWSNLSKAGSATQIVIYPALASIALGESGFLFLSLLLFLHALIQGTLLLLLESTALSVLQLPMYPFLLLVSFNLFSGGTYLPLITTLSSWWGTLLRLSGPIFVLLEAISTLLVVQSIGITGKELAAQGESWQFALLILAALGYVGSAWWISVSYAAASTSPLSSTLLGVALTAFIFITLIGLSLRRSNIIESCGFALFLAFNVWLAGFQDPSLVEPATSNVLPQIMPHLRTLHTFFTVTLPKPILIALVYRLVILYLASQILPRIGGSNWEDDGGRPTSRLTRMLLTYRQAIAVTVYSHLLLLDPAAHAWWRWILVILTMLLWAIEIVLGNDDVDLQKEWKID